MKGYKNYRLRGKKQSLKKVKLGLLNLVRLLLLDSKEMNNVKFKSTKSLNAETHWQTHTRCGWWLVSLQNQPPWKNKAWPYEAAPCAPWLWPVPWRPTLPQEVGSLWNWWGMIWLTNGPWILSGPPTDDDVSSAGRSNTRQAWDRCVRSHYSLIVYIPIYTYLPIILI